MPRLSAVCAAFVLAVFLTALTVVVAPRAADEMPQHIKERLASMGTALTPETARVTRHLYGPLAHHASRRGVTITRNVAYGRDPLQVLDVFRPDGYARVPIVVFVHGGGFIGGDKDRTADFYGNVPTYFARNGMLGINANYRLAPEAPWPAGAQDVGRVVAWVKEHAVTYGGDPERIVLMGHSAGATHVASYAFDASVHPAGGPGIAGVVSLAGVYRVSERPPANVQAYFGTDASRYAARSPLTHAGTSNVPAFLVVAQYDPVFLVTASLELMRALCERDARCPRLAWLAHHNHISMVAHLNTGDEVLGPQILEFVRTGR